MKSHSLQSKQIHFRPPTITPNIKQAACIQFDKFGVKYTHDKKGLIVVTTSDFNLPQWMLTQVGIIANNIKVLGNNVTIVKIQRITND